MKNCANCKHFHCVPENEPNRFHLTCEHESGPEICEDGPHDACLEFWEPKDE